MKLFRKLASFFSGPARGGSPLYPLVVECHRCHEIIQGQVNLHNDLSIDYNDSGEVIGFHCRKVLIGSGRCFQQIEISLSFNASRELVEQEITGGKFVQDTAS